MKSRDRSRIERNRYELHYASASQNSGAEVPREDPMERRRRLAEQLGVKLGPNGWVDPVGLTLETYYTLTRRTSRNPLQMMGDMLRMAHGDFGHLTGQNGVIVSVLTDEDPVHGKTVDEDFSLGLIFERHPELRNAVIQRVDDYLGSPVYRVTMPEEASDGQSRTDA